MTASYLLSVGPVLSINIF